MECHLAWSHLGVQVPPEARAQLDDAVTAFKSRGLVTFAAITMACPCLHMLFHALIKRYAKSVGEAQRTAASHHALELLFGTVGTPIAFAATRRLMFCLPHETFTRNLIDAMLGCSLGVCAMYASELSGRLSSTRPLTAVHHLLTMAFFVSILIETNELMVVTGSLFVTGALVEAPLFAGLLLYRFREGRERLAWWVLAIGLVTYASTRIAQLCMHIAIVASFDLTSFPSFTLCWVLVPVPWNMYL